MNLIVDSKALKQFQYRIKQYEAHRYFYHEIAKRLFARLPYMKIMPRQILDIGGDLFTLTQLKKQYPDANIIQHAMTSLNNFSYKKNQFDLVVANLSLHFAEDMFSLLAKIRNSLKPDGLLLFSTLGPDTLIELHQAFLQAEDKWHVYPFMDMHPIGDELVRLQFFEPVVDMEKITLQYEALDDLFFDLKNTGSQNSLLNRSRGLQGKKAWQKMLASYPKNEKGFYPVTGEVIYGQAWVKGPRLAKVNADNEVLFSTDNGLLTV